MFVVFARILAQLLRAVKQQGSRKCEKRKMKL